MKILLLSPFLPSPPRFGGQRRIDGLARELAQRHEVSVLALNRPDEWMDSSLEVTRSYCREVVSLPERDFEERDKRVLQLKSLGSLHSFEHVVKAKRADFQRELDRMLEEHSYDVVQYEFVHMAPFGFDKRRFPRTVFVLDEHNIEYDVLKRTAEARTNLPRRVYNALNWRKLEREERASWRRFDGILATSERDATFIRRDLPSARVLVAPNGVDVREFTPVTGGEEPETLLFFGAINYFPNQDGVVYFIDHVFPLIRARRPNARFVVVGPGANEQVLARQGNGVEILGMVESVAPYIDRASAVVVPLRIGGGTRLKIVEALAKGKPVVSTRLGAEGIEVVDGQHLLLADEPADFAAAVERLFTEPGLGARLGAGARRLAEERYSWTHVVSGLERFFTELVAARPSRAS
ncbi:MAG TPA: glycosyltransferase family 4 protein, partial [Polyangiaceae bacterium]|nr:glycosyltransferase family 4 protein [Polyangiaceae bacterium]